MATETSSHESSHPTALKYVGIAVVWSVITLVEVWAVFQGALRAVLLPLLLMLSAIKFALVAMFYMHLKFDNRLFTVFFVGGFVLAVGVLLALGLLFQFFST